MWWGIRSRGFDFCVYKVRQARIGVRRLDPTYDYHRIGEKLSNIILEERIIILEMQTATTDIKLP